MTPARLIHGHASDALRARGVRPSVTAVAAVVGEVRQGWARYLDGAVAPNTAKVEAWLAALEREGMPLALTVDAGGGASRPRCPG